MPVGGDVTAERPIWRPSDLSPEDKDVQAQEIQFLKEPKCQGRDLDSGQEILQLLELFNQ